MAQEPENVTFEEGIEKLEEIVSMLEQGDITLEKALQLYEQGKILVKTCTTMLDDAENKIEYLEKGQ